MNYYIFYYSIPIILFGTLLHAVVVMRSNKTFPHGKNEDVILKAREGKGLIISSLGVQGYENFNILAQTFRPYYLANDLKLIPFPSKKDLNYFINILKNIPIKSTIVIDGLALEGMFSIFKEFKISTLFSRIIKYFDENLFG